MVMPKIRIYFDPFMWESMVQKLLKHTIQALNPLSSRWKKWKEKERNFLLSSNAIFSSEMKGNGGTKLPYFPS